MAPDGGALAIAEADESRMWDYGWKTAIGCRAVAVRFLRGNKMRAVDGLFNEISAACQFPYYFGENWPAFTECLSDLSWLNSDQFVLIMMRAEEILADEPADVGAFCRSLTSTIEEHATQFSLLHPRNGAGAPFQVILHCLPGRVEGLATLVTNLGMQVRSIVV